MFRIINVILYIKLISRSPVSTPQYIIHLQYLVHSVSHVHRKHYTHQAISVPDAKYIQNILYGKTNKIHLPIPVAVKSANTPSASPQPRKTEVNSEPPHVGRQSTRTASIKRTLLLGPLLCSANPENGAKEPSVHPLLPRTPHFLYRYTSRYPARCAAQVGRGRRECWLVKEAQAARRRPLSEGNAGVQEKRIQRHGWMSVTGA